MDCGGRASLVDRWNSAVLNGEVLTQVLAGVSDPRQQWQAGDRLLFGVRMNASGPEYVASNLSAGGNKVRADVEERIVSGTDFVCQFNGYRALRPRGNTLRAGRQADISPAMEDCRFSCQDRNRHLSLLSRRPLAQRQLRNWCWNAYSNAFPFEATGHLLWVPVLPGNPVRIPHFTQLLTRAFLEDLLQLASEEPSWTFSYSALHAGASVNHTHVQSVLHSRWLAVELAPVVHHSGFTCLAGTPSQALVFDVNGTHDLIEQSVGRLRTQNVPFNLVLVHGKAFLFARNIDHEVVAEFPGDVLACTDFAGKIITSNRAVYEKVDAYLIRRAFSKTCLRVDAIAESWQQGATAVPVVGHLERETGHTGQTGAL
jgi:hypothetical protein